MTAVLIVDDEPGIRLVLELALRAAGHEVVSTGDASDARRVATEQRIDVALVDVHLAGACGLQLLDELRRHDPALCGIAMTGAPLDPGWGVPVLAKPFSITAVTEVVDAATPSLVR